jgi:quercetin dioxygenase-like cupin family protein
VEGQKKVDTTMAEQPADEALGHFRPSGGPKRSVLHIDVAAVIARLHQETSWQQGEDSDRTLVAESDVRVVLAAMHSGARLTRHATAARFTLQVLQGSLAIEVSGDTMTLAPGHIVVLNRGVPHALTALTDCAFLITVV